MPEDVANNSTAKQAQVNAIVEQQLDTYSKAIEAELEADVMTIRGPIYYGLEESVRQAIESRANKRNKLAIVLETDGGLIEVVERMVKVIRHHYTEVIMIVPNMAMSAGTVFAMSGDIIMMDYFSCLGPIDPQIRKNGRFVPALSYLVQFERLKEASNAGTLTTVEVTLAQQLDLAELHSFEEARDLSISLLKEWLAKYKFKNWITTETNQTTVTQEIRENRAEEIAKLLMNHQRWHSHGRPICMEILKRDLNLRIDDLELRPELNKKIQNYQTFLSDYMTKMRMDCVVHTDGVFLQVG